MQLAFITALGVGGATIFGVLLGFMFQKVPHDFNDVVLGYAAGIMLAAAVNGLIMPAFEMAGVAGVLLPVAGIFAGALFLNLMDKFTPHLHKLSGVDIEEHQDNRNLSRAMLFVMAVALHNLPEGLAAGVGFGNDDVSAAITVAVGIALQNIPEGIVTVSPLVMAGVKRSRAVILASVTGLTEVLGTFIDFSLTSVSDQSLACALAFAGGTMLYVISDEMIPETHSHGFERRATYSLLVGFTVMLILDMVI